MAAEFKEYEYVEAGKIDISQLPPLDPETEHTMKTEFGTGFKLTIFYFAFIMSIPVLNWYATDFFFSPFWGGMTFSWFTTTIIGFTMAFVIAYIHIYLYEKRLREYQETEKSNNHENRRITG